MNLIFFKTLCLSVLLFNGNLIAAQQQCLKGAWAAFNAGNYEEAINLSDQCIEDFGKKALRMQDELEGQGKTSADFPSGAVSEETKNRILKNWAVNDVATACYLKGRAAEYIYKKDKKKNRSYKELAIGTYLLADKYSFGRCWDPRGWFWNPGQAAVDRLPLN